MTGSSKDQDELPKEEAERRRDELARRLLRTPPEPREKAAERGKRKRQSASESEKGKERKPGA